MAIDHGDVLFADFVNHYYPTVATSLRQGAPAGGFFYPAGFAALLSPLSLVGPKVALAMWAMIQIACLLVVATWLVRVAVGEHRLLALVGTALTVTSVPVLHNLKWGQVSLPILAATGCAFTLRSRGRSTWPASLLGIASGIKGYPLVFVGWFMAKRDLRFAARAGIACIVTLVLLPALLMGPRHALFFQRVSSGAVLGAADGVLRDFNSQYAPAVLGRHHGGWDAMAADVRALGMLGSIAALVVIVAAIVLVAHSEAPAIRDRREVLGLLLIACSVPFWLRTSWSHYFVHLPLTQIALGTMLGERLFGSCERRPREDAERAPQGAPRRASARGRAALVLVILLAPSIFLSSVLGLFASEGWWYYANAGTLFFANALVLLAMLALIIEAHVDFATSGADRATNPQGPLR